MEAGLFRGLILAAFAFVAACSAGQLAESWEHPHDVTARDLFHGSGGAGSAPAAGVTYTWLATDTMGYSPGYEVRGPDGRTWDVKLGVESQSEVVASRVLWASGRGATTSSSGPSRIAASSSPIFC